MPFTELPPPPEWDIPLSPNDIFYTLPRIRRTTQTGLAEIVQFERGTESIDKLRKSNSHCESIV